MIAETRGPLLARLYPAARAIPWIPLATIPTPVEPLPIGAFGDRLWVKRDDLSSDVYGGNKVRKLEFLLAEALADGTDRLITAGAAGSHHALATAVFGHRLGLATTLVLFPQPVTDHVRAVLLRDAALGAELRWVPRMEAVPAGLLAARWAHRKERYRVVPPGGSDAAGTLGYVNAALELQAQIHAGEAPVPRVAHTAAGTLGTAVGLAIGFSLADLPTRVAAHRIAGRIVTNELALRRLVDRTLALLRRAGVPVPSRRAVLNRLDLRHDHFGSGYGAASRPGERAAAIMRDAGLSLDPTYTAKAAAALIAGCEAEPGCHLFWHTLGGRLPEVEPAPEADLPRPFRRYLSRGNV